MLIGVLFATALIGAAPGDPAPVGPSKPGVKNPANEKICKAEDVTGSRLGGFKVCMTRAQWDERAAGNRDVTSSWQMQGMQNQR